MQVAIYVEKDPDGKRFLATLRRRIEKAEIRAWEVRRLRPLTLVHSGDRYARVRVTFAPANTPRVSPAMRSRLSASGSSPPSLLATISKGPSADRVLGFLVGLLTRHAGPLGVAEIGIPLDQASSRPRH